MKSIIVINPGSTSTKLSVFSFEGNLEEFDNIDLLKESMNEEIKNEISTGSFNKDIELRKKKVMKFVKGSSEKIGDTIAVAGRGGLLKPLNGGIYKVNKAMLNDLSSCKYGMHASNMGAILAAKVAKVYKVDSFIADSVVVDELDDITRYTGIPEITKKSIFHALNHKSIARKVAKNLNREYRELNIIVAHLGGGSSIGLHCKGRVVDVNNALDGEGPFAIERAGTIPAGDLVKLCFSGKYTYDEIYSKLVGKGGIYAWLGTKDAKKIESILLGRKDIANSNLRERENIKDVLDAFIYQVSKSICALSAYTNGNIDAIAITGGLVYFDYVVKGIERRVLFLAKVFVLPAEDEMRALAENVILGLKGKEEIQSYRSEK